MPTLLLSLLGLGTLAFGAVYPWAYVPLFAAAAIIGATGLARYGVAPELRPVAAALVALWIVTALQVIPLPRAVLDVVSPSTAVVASGYRLDVANDAAWLPLSIDPVRTRVALAALGALGLYLLGAPQLVGAHGLRRFARGLAVFAVPLALFAIYTREHNNGLIYGFWQPLDGGGADQAGPFINRNHFGGWLVMSLSVMMGSLLGRIERLVVARRRHEYGAVSADLGPLLLMGSAVALCTMSLFWIVSRSAIISFGIAMGLLAGLALGRRRLGTSARALVLVTLGAIVLAGVSWRGVDVLVGWFLDERSLLSRIDAWRDGWGVVRAFPWLGTGLNTFSPAMLFYQTRNPGFHMAQAHNDYLQLLAEGGVIVSVAAAITVLLLARAIVRAIRAARIETQGYWVRAGAGVGLAAIACQELVEFSLQIPVNAFLCCTLATLAVTPLYARAPRAATSRDPVALIEESAVAAVS